MHSLAEFRIDGGRRHVDMGEEEGVEVGVGVGVGGGIFAGESGMFYESAVFIVN